MVDFTNHTETVRALEEAQDAEKENREMSREAHSFIDERDGQWEINFTQNKDKPRYTFDIVTSIVDQIAGEFERSDLDSKITPAGDGASKEVAKIFDGMIRNIENVSNAKHTYNAAARSMITGGISGWGLATEFVDDDSFNQDIVIKEILDFDNQVWFDPGAKKQDKSDSGYGFKLVSKTKEQYKEKWPKGSGTSVTTNMTDIHTNSCFGKDDIFVGQVFWKKEVKRTLVMMENGSVFDKDSEEFKKVKDDLAQAGINVKKDDDGNDMERSRPKTVVMRRMFDGSDWLDSETETVFSWIPLVPAYGNYKINNNKMRYRGVVEKLFDPQRVMNYSLSREIEEGALAPRAKTWMTPKQAAGHESTLATLNTNSDPVQFYNIDEQTPGIPGQTGGAQINPGLRIISDAMQQMIGTSAGLFAANMGDNPGLQSGVAISKLQDKGDNGTIQYFSAMEIAICHTDKIMIDAMPRVYDTERQVRILQKDGAFDMEVLNKEVFDQESGETVTLNDLSAGKYDAICTIGPSFANRQQEAVAGIIEAASVNPEIMQLGSDVLMKNMTFPGAEIIGERLRKQLFQAGVIPEDQWSDEEQQQAQQAQQQAAQQGQQPDALMVAAQAEVIKAKNEEVKTQVSVEEKSAKIQIAANRERREDAKFQHTVNSDRTKTAIEQQENAAQFGLDRRDSQRQDIDGLIDNLLKLAQAVKTSQEAAEGPIQGPGLLDNVREGSDMLSDAQDATQTALRLLPAP